MDKSIEIEWLDTKHAKGEELKRVSGELDFINRNFGNLHALKSAFKQFLGRMNKKDTIRLLDVGCGSGFILDQLIGLGSSLGYSIEFIAIDANEHMLELARINLESKRGTFMHVEVDVNSKLPPCDLLISSHFLYHLKAEELPQFIANNKTQVKHLMLFSELRPSWWWPRIFPVIGKMIRFHRHTIQDGVKALQRSHPKSTFLQDQFKSLGNLSIRKKPFNRFIIHLEVS